MPSTWLQFERDLGWLLESVVAQYCGLHLQQEHAVAFQQRAASLLQLCGQPLLDDPLPFAKLQHLGDASHRIHQRGESRDPSIHLTELTWNAGVRPNWLSVVQ